MAGSVTLPELNLTPSPDALPLASDRQEAATAEVQAEVTRQAAAPRKATTKNITVT